jgi:hypothetical protein
MGVKARGVPRPCFSPPSQPFPASATAQERQLNGAPFPARGRSKTPLLPIEYRNIEQEIG